MSNPLQNRGDAEQRRSDAEKVLAVLDLVRVIVNALFGIFGRRKEDR